MNIFIDYLGKTVQVTMVSVFSRKWVLTAVYWGPHSGRWEIADEPQENDRQTIKFQCYGARQFRIDSLDNKSLTGCQNTSSPCPTLNSFSLSPHSHVLIHSYLCYFLAGNLWLTLDSSWSNWSLCPSVLPAIWPMSFSCWASLLTSCLPPQIFCCLLFGVLCLLQERLSPRCHFQWLHLAVTSGELTLWSRALCLVHRPLCLLAS